MAGVGAVRDDVSGAVLGTLQRGAALLRVHRQAVHPILPQAAELIPKPSAPDPGRTVFCSLFKESSDIKEN